MEQITAFWLHWFALPHNLTYDSDPPDDIPKTFDTMVPAVLDSLGRNPELTGSGGSLRQPVGCQIRFTGELISPREWYHLCWKGEICPLVDCDG